MFEGVVTYEYIKEIKWIHLKNLCSKVSYSIIYFALEFQDSFIKLPKIWNFP